MPRVLNKHKMPAGETGVYIGRGSQWGNPFRIGPDGNRDQVCDKFANYIKARPELTQRARNWLQGRNLICFCAPLRCHGDLLLRIANEETT